MVLGTRAKSGLFEMVVERLPGTHVVCPRMRRYEGMCGGLRMQDNAVSESLRIVRHQIVA